MEKSTLKSNIAKPSIPSNQTANSQKSTNIPPEYFNSDNLIEDQASQRPYFNDKQESDSQDTTNISQGYFNPSYITEDQASQINYFDENQPLPAVQTATVGYPGYNRSPQYAFRTSSNSNANPAPQPRTRELTETLTFKGNDGQSYNVLPHLNLAQAREVETQSGVLLRKDPANPDRYIGELGRGNFGRVYVAKLVNSDKYVAVKIIRGDDSVLIDSSHESTLQRKLTQAVDSRDSQLMSMDDAVSVE